MITHRAFFGDAERDFTLGFDQIRELQRKTGTGIGALAKRVEARDFHLDDVLETIRLALIGGGTEPKEAADLIAAYVAPRPIEEAMILATEILATLYFGIPAATPEVSA